MMSRTEIIMTNLFSMKAVFIIGCAAIGLAACGGSDNNYVPPPVADAPAPPPPPPPAPEPPQTGTAPEQAGAGFNSAFLQGPFDEPVEPMAGDISAVDETAEPIDIPNP